MYAIRSYYGSPFNAPASLLAHLFGSQESPVELAIISGPSGAGKTTWCLRLAEKARGLGLEVAGLISQPVMAVITSYSIHYTKLYDRYIYNSRGLY